MVLKTVTITDVARKAGVSISTVSRVVNNSMPVGDELRAKVIEAVDALGYQPNFLAQNLRRPTVGRIGIVVPDVNNAFFIQMAKGIQDFYLKQHRTVSLYDSNSDPEREIYLVEELIRNQIAGVFFASGRQWEFQDHIEDLCERGIPVCMINRQVNGDIPVDIILNNQTRGHYDATMHLINLGPPLDRLYRPDVTWQPKPR